jgi:regulatory protein
LWLRKTKNKERAKNYAFLLLKFRQRSQKELVGRLKQKGFSDPVIKETLAFLKNKGLINDHAFAQAWVEERLKRSLGLGKIKQELILKGIDEEIINHQIAQIKENYCEEDIAREIAQVSLNKLKGISPNQAKRRVYAYLLRRGFSVGLVEDVLGQLGVNNLTDKD